VGTALAAAAPQITDNAWEGQTLQLTPGDLAITDQWYLCTDAAGTSCTSTGDLDTTFAISDSSDVGDYVKVTETDLDLSTPDSNIVGPVTPSEPTAVTRPAISDTSSGTRTITEGDTVTNTADGTWSVQPPDSVSRQWLRCPNATCSAISGATGTSYTTTRDDVGQSIELAETPTYGPTTLDTANASSPTATVIPTPPQNDHAAPPVISPTTPIVGEMLSATTGNWSNQPTGYAYQWQRCNPSCQNIDGATGSTYTPTSADVGDTVDVVVTASVLTTAGMPTTSAQTAAVLPLPPSDVTEPTITGNTLQGLTLTASVGTWAGNPTSYTYQWQDCDTAGANCAAISGATSFIYATTPSDVGHTLVVAVSGVNAGGTGQPVLSAATDLVRAASDITLGAAPSPALANQTVTMTATVNSRQAGTTPRGTVEFLDHGQAIGGCGDQPITPGGQSVTVTCQTTFAGETAQLSATYHRSDTSFVDGSTSAVHRVFINRDSTSTGLDVTPTLKVRQRTTFTATVGRQAHLPGTLMPSGTVEFMDAGKPIAGCAKRPVAGGGATCTLTYHNPGTHSIRARFGGDSSFRSSSSAIKRVKVRAIPVKGSITATMQWTFRYTPRYTDVIAMVVNGVPRGGTVHVRCSGKGCPFATHQTKVGKRKPCTKKDKSDCPARGRVGLTGLFKHHHLRVGAQITIVILKRQYIGKYYNFLVRARRQPRVRIDCLAVDATKPGVGC
jgi:hypothetical protein